MRNYSAASLTCVVRIHISPNKGGLARIQHQKVLEYVKLGCVVRIMEEKLVWTHLHVVDEVAKKMRIEPSDVAELGLQTLWDILPLYDPQRSTFKTFAQTCLRKKFLMWQRTQEGVQFEHLGERDPEKLATQSFGQFGEIDLKVIEELRGRVSEDEWAMLQEHFVDGDSLYRVGVRRGVIRQTIHRRIQKLLERARRD